MADPDRAGEIGREPCEEHALVVRVRAGLAGDGHAVDARGAAAAALHGVHEHVHEHVGRALAEDLALALGLLGLHVQDDVAVRVRDLGEGQGLLVGAGVGDGAKGLRHLAHRDAGGAQRKAGAVGVDVIRVDAHGLQVLHAVGDADHAHERVGRNRVQRGAHARAQRHHPAVGAGGEVGGIALGRAPALDGHRQVGGDRPRRVPLVQRRPVDRQGLDGGADGHVGVRRAVEHEELRLRRAAAHDRADLAGCVVVDHAGGLGLNGLRAAGVFVRGVRQLRIVLPVVEHILDDVLDLRVDGGVDVVAAFLNFAADGGAVFARVLQVAVREQLRHRVVEHRFHGGGHVVQVVDRGILHHGERIRERRVVLRLGDEPIVVHALQHVVRAVVDDARLARAVVVAARVVAAGVAGDGRKGRALAQRQLRQVLVVVVLGRSLDAVVALAQGDDVEVPLQDLLLGVFALQLDGQVRLLQLALVALLGGQQRGLDELLGDGGAALRALVLQVGDKGADDALDVDAVMGEEARVLHGHKGVDQILRDLVVIGPDAVLRSLVGGDELAVAVVDEGGEVLRLDLVHVQVRRRLVVALGHAHQRAEAADPEDQHHHKQDADRVAQHREDEVWLLIPGLERGEGRAARLAALRGFGIVLVLLQHAGSSWEVGCA